MNENKLQERLEYWTEKYKPKNLEGVIGNRTAIDALRNFNWKKPLLVYGGPGVGKSALVNAIASEKNFNLVELSDENMENELKKIETFFDAVSNEHTEWGWRFDRNVFLKEIDNIDMYLNAKNYNL